MCADAFISALHRLSCAHSHLGHGGDCTNQAYPHLYPLLCISHHVNTSCFPDLPVSTASHASHCYVQLTTSPYQHSDSCTYTTCSNLCSQARMLDMAALAIIHPYITCTP